MKKTLQEKLYGVSDTVIVSYSYDLLAHKIVMVFKKGSTRHTVEFLRVATAYHVNGMDERGRKKILPREVDDRLEIDDITVIENPVSIDVISPIGDTWVEACHGGGNIGIEIYGQSIVIEAAEVHIDGESFVIGDW